jgi:hypothetical protein
MLQRFLAYRAGGPAVTFGKAKTSARGYGISHQRLRKKWAARVERGEVYCTRCGKWIQPGTPWDLDHDDADSIVTGGSRTNYLGPSHRGCNRAWPNVLASRRRAAARGDGGAASRPTTFGRDEGLGRGSRDW